MIKAVGLSLCGALLLSASLLGPVSAHAAELLMFERGGCIWCARWNRDVGALYDRTDEARLLPLRRIDLDHPGQAAVKLASPVLYTPTFVVIDQGREVGRITGYISDDSFWGLLGTFVAKLAPPPAAPDRT